MLKARVDADNGKKANIWLPIFIIWPVVLVLGLALLPIVLLVAIGFMIAGRREGVLLLVAGPMLFDLVCASRGLRVDVRQVSNTVYLELK